MDAFEKWLRDNDGVEDGKWEYAEKAFRAGMREAADIADTYSSVEGIAQRIRDAILAEADK